MIVCIQVVIAALLYFYIRLRFRDLEWTTNGRMKVIAFCLFLTGLYFLCCLACFSALVIPAGQKAKW